MVPPVSPNPTLPPARSATTASADFSTGRTSRIGCVPSASWPRWRNRRAAARLRRP